MPRRLTLLAALVALSLSSTAGGASEGALRDRISSSRSAERSLAAAAAKLGRLERESAREVTILEGRVSDAQAQLDRARGEADRTAARLAAARGRAARLKIRLGQVQGRLALLLRERYESDPPDLITVVLNSDGFSQVLETIRFLQTVQRRDAEILGLVRSAKADALRERRVLAVLTVQRRRFAVAVRRRRDALAQIASGLRARRDALARARAARLAALSNVRSRRVRAQRELTRLIAARERASLIPGPGGPWAIPWPVVQCESGGQNLPPNYATASGYYQMIDDTWRRLGGSTPHAYQASKAEQDRLAARLWAGGSGAGNWVCAALVGII